MSATIKIELDDKGARKKLDELGDEAKQAADAVDEMGKEAKQAGDATAKMGQQVDLAAKETQELQSQIKKLVAAYVSIEAGKAVIQGLASASVTLAEKGSPAFVKLKDSVDAIHKSLLDLGNDPAIQGLASSLAGGFDSLSDSIDTIPGRLRGFRKDFAMGIASLGESLGVFSANTTEILSQMQKEGERSLELAKKRIEAEQQLMLNKKNNEKVEELLKQAEVSRFQETYQSLLAQISTMAQLDQAQEDAIAHVKELAKENKVTAEELAKFQVRLQVFAVRRQEIRAEEERAETEAAAEQKKRQEEKDRLAIDSMKAALARSREAIELEEKANEELTRKAREAADQRLAEMEQRIQRIAQAVAALEKKGEGKQGILPQVRADDRDVKKRENKLKRDEVQRRLEEIEAERENALEFARTSDDPKAEREVNREFDKRAQQARKEVARQGKGGEFQGQARAEVESEMAGELIDRAERSGRLDREQVGALREAQRALATQRAEQEQMAAQLAQLTDAMRQLAKPVNNRARAQRMAGGI